MNRLKMLLNRLKKKLNKKKLKMKIATNKGMIHHIYMRIKKKFLIIKNSINIIRKC